MTKRELNGVTRDIAETTSQSTVNYKLPLWQGNDVTSWMTQVNDAMDKIDTGMHAAQSKADGMQTSVDEAIDKGNQAIGLYEGLGAWKEDVETNVDTALADSAKAKGDAEQAVTAAANAITEVQSLQTITDSLQDDVMNIGAVQMIERAEVVMYEDELCRILSVLTIYQNIGDKKFCESKCVLDTKNSSTGAILYHLATEIANGKTEINRETEFGILTALNTKHNIKLTYLNTSMTLVYMNAEHVGYLIETRNDATKFIINKTANTNLPISAVFSNAVLIGYEKEE